MLLFIQSLSQILTDVVKSETTSALAENKTSGHPVIFFPQMARGEGPFSSVTLFLVPSSHSEDNVFASPPRAGKNIT